VKATPWAIVAAAAALAAVPWLGLPPFYASFGYLVLSWVVLATSWNLLSGYAGYFSFGHGAFYGAGLYTTATLTTRLDWPFLATLPVAGAVAALLALAIGAVVFRVKRVRGELFALLTLAVTFVLATIVLNTPIDGGPGVYLNAVAVPNLAPTQPGTFYLLALVVATASVLAALGIAHSRFGAGLFAIHDDEDAAEVMGVPTFRAKLGALALSAALAGVAGGIHALFISYVTAGEVFSITVPLTVVLMSVLGGTRHWAGPAVGALAITCLLYAFTSADQAVLGKAVMGTVLVATILFMPQGVLARVGDAARWARMRRLEPARAVTHTAKSPATAESHATNESHTTVESPAIADATAAPVASATAGAPLLRVHGLVKAFAGVRALDGVDVEVREGEILGLLGPNGSGKSTFINVVSGHYASTAGRIEFAGRDLTRLPAHRIARAGVSRTYQIPRPFQHLSVLDNVAIAAMYGGETLPR